MDSPESRFEDTTFAFVDVETTGFSPQHDRRIDAFESLIDPGCPIPATASAVHHLTDECVRGAPALDAVTPWLKAFVADAVVVAHNAPFDLGFLPFLRLRPTLCSMRFAQLVLPDAPNYKNQVLRYHLGVRDPALLSSLPHRALGDAIVTSLIFDYCVGRYLAAGGIDRVARAIEETIAPRLLTAFRFGRHRGQPIAEVPSDYLSWLVAEAASPSSDARYTAQSELNRRRLSRHGPSHGRNVNDAEHLAPI
jgi:exodeoxyribonuclease X